MTFQTVLAYCFAFWGVATLKDAIVGNSLRTGAVGLALILIGWILTVRSLI